MVHRKNWDAMNTNQQTKITLEEAIARLMGIEYVPIGHTVLELLTGFVSDSEDRLVDAQKANASQPTLTMLRHHLNVCEGRLKIAESLAQCLTLEIQQPNSEIRSSTDESAIPTLDWYAVQDWAEENFGLTGFTPIASMSNAPDAKPEIETSLSSADDRLEDIPALNNTVRKLFPKGQVGVAKAKNLLVTFHYLLFIHINKHPQRSRFFTGKAERLIVDDLAKELQAEIKKELGDASASGQGHEAIKDRIEAAVAVWDAAKKRI